MGGRSGQSVAPLPGVIDIARRLMAFPSPQTELLEAEPQILRYLDRCVVPLLGDCGLPHRRDGMGNVIVELGEPAEGADLLLVTYAMTHPAAGMRDAFSPSIVVGEDGPALRGRGACEQKGALAAAVWATARAARIRGHSGRLSLLILTAGETGRHTAVAEALLSCSSTPDLGIVAVGTSNRVTLGNMGRIDITLRIKGRAAHSGSPWLGVDAVQGTREVLNRLATLELPENEHPGLGKVTLTVTSLRSWPQATHTVQDVVELTLDRRLLPGEDPERAVKEIEALVRHLDPWVVELERGPFMLPSEVPSGSSVLNVIRSGSAHAGLNAPETCFSRGGLDAGYLNAVGCQTVMWGPGDPAQWHTNEEQVPVAELERAAAGYLGTITVRQAHLNPATSHSMLTEEPQNGG